MDHEVRACQHEPVSDESLQAGVRQSLRVHRRSIAVLAAVVLVLFGRVGGYEFTLDSRYFLLEDERVSQFQVGAMFTTDWWDVSNRDAVEVGTEGGLYRPLSLLWLASMRAVTTDAALRERKSVPVNLGNVLLHLIGVVLRFMLLLAILEGLSGARKWALVGALILAVHPISTEVVATQVGAAEGLCIVLSTASMLLFLRALDRGGGVAWGLHGMTLFLALLSKESAVAMPGAMVLMAWLLRGRGLLGGLRAAIPSMLVVLSWLGLRAVILGSVVSVGDPVLAQFPVTSSIATAFAVIGAYDLQAIFLPLWLHPNPSVQEIPAAVGSGDPRVVLGLVSVTALVAGGALAWRRAPRVAFGLGFFGGTLLPVTNLIVPIGALAATRFLYLPLTGAVVAIAAGCARLDGPRGRLIAWGLAGWFLVVPGWLCVSEVGVWSDQGALFEVATERYPGAPQGWYQVGVSELERAAGGDPAAFARAGAAFDRAMECQIREIPGRPGIYHEDALEVVYQAAMNRASLARRSLGDIMRRGDRLGFDQAIERAERALRRGFEMTQRGLKIADGGAGAKTDWRSLGTDVLLQRVSLRLQRFGILRPEQRASALEGVAVIVQRMRDLHPRSVRTALAALQLRSARSQMKPEEFGRALQGLFQRSLRTSISEARDVVQAYVGHLHGQKRPGEAARAFLEAHFAGVVTPNAMEVCRAGLEAVKAREASTRALGQRALRQVIAGPDGLEVSLLTQARAALAR
ncbi:MAG: hypothetical protein CMJ90_14590 [Planctomycetes bacterium]|nr:hypothetical protein [Planctomycetota bacterium]